MPGTAVVNLLFAAGGAVALIGSLAAAVKWLQHLSRDLRDLRLDWHGEPERPGFPARLGVMERLAAQDIELAAIRADLAALTGHITGPPDPRSSDA